jgi:DNA-directed RNA polymerase subunit RPC12/RpoP
VATASFKCPNCGAGLLFDPALQKPKCDFCLSEFTIADLDAYNQNLENQATRAASREAAKHPDETGAVEDHLIGYHCNSCGAEVVTEETTAATFCYYCHNPVLLTERLSGTFRPQKVIPFAFDKDKAVAIFKNWAGKRKYVPKDFTSTSQLEKTTGLYLPHWMADYQAAIDYAGTATNLRMWVAGNMEYTEHKEFAIARQGTIDVNHVHEVAIRKIDKHLIDSITPYDESHAVDFSLSYLSGFFAEKYDILQPDVQPIVENRVRQYATTLVQETIGAYNRVNMTRKDVNLIPKAWHYALLPAWILTYFYRGKTFIYAINGQTGKVHGELPVDQKKLGLTSALIAAVVLILLLLGGLFIW